jgi:hypothetical protein
MSASAPKPENSSNCRANKNDKSLPRICGPHPSSETGKHLAQLFPNGWNWIYASAPEVQTAPQWETINQFPLAPVEMEQLHQDTESLVGIRPGSQTRWLIIDIDKDSDYHPTTNENWLPRIQKALEDIGIARILTCQSSHSGGLHLYLPIPQPVSSFWFSICVKLHLEAIGIKLHGGQCELYPNPKRYVPKGKGFSLFAAIRLPMQPNSGFYPLDQDLNPLPWNLGQWLDAFEQAASLQDFPLLQSSIIHAQEAFQLRRRYHPQSIDSWQSHIDQEKKQGWTGPGQSNAKFKTLACDARVFQAMDSVEQIAAYIEQAATEMPGFHEFSNHVKDIRQRSRDVAQWALKFYWPNGSAPQRETQYHSQEKAPADFGYHQSKRDAARYRITQALEQLKEASNLPNGISDRAEAIIEIAHVSKQTLYRNKPLWHPQYLQDQPTALDGKSQSGQESTQHALENSTAGISQLLKSLWLKVCTQLFIYVGFVLLAQLSAATALALQGKRAGQAALEVQRTLHHCENSNVSDCDNVSSIQNWQQLKLSLPARFQDKVKQVELKRNLNSDASVRLPKQMKLCSELHDKNVPERLQSLPPLSFDDLEPIELTERAPTSAEVKEFRFWYDLADRLRLVSDYRWENRQYWVLIHEEWKTYAEMSATFTVRSLRRML